ncbi:DUF6498-containing protein [Akkermansiaceae bacterium]|nr:DUF6498-containing protein [Akkermansiaceae bacterium]MDB4538164.1 DUF6498-containing protein [Akkermansiaceae bacterium]
MFPHLLQILRRPSAIVLLIANLVPVLGVLFLDWDVVNLLYLYWAENVAVGLVNVLKLLSNRHEDSVLGGKIFLSIFFTIHYGGFCVGHAAFVFGGMLPGTSSFGSPVTGAIDYLTSHPLLFLGFFGSHLFSYFTNYLGRGEDRRIPLGKVMFLPYGRIFVLHITIIFGGIAITALGSPLILVLVLAVLKTVGDLYFHSREHGRSGETIPPSP